MSVCVLKCVCTSMKIVIVECVNDHKWFVGFNLGNEHPRRPSCGSENIRHAVSPSLSRRSDVLIFFNISAILLFQKNFLEFGQGQIKTP